MTSAEHQPTAEDIMACFDGELPPHQATAIRSHVAACTICQQVIDGLNETCRELAQWTIDDPPASLQLADTPTVRSATRWPAVVRWTRRPAVWRFTGVAAAAGLVLVALVLPFARYSVSPFMDAAPPSPATVAASAESTRFGTGGGSGGRAVARPLSGVVMGQGEPAPAQPAEGPMIARWARLDIIASRFDDVNPAIDRILREVKGFAGNIDATAARGASRSLNATLRVPAGSLETAIASLKQLGHVVAESRGGDDVAEQVMDIAARLANARNTEVRLTDVLRQRTGKVSDVLEAEREIARVRGEIERLDAERKNLDRRVTYATVTLTVSEEPKAALDIGPIRVSARYRNAMVDGARAAFESLLEVSLVILRVAPTLAVWAAVLFWPARIVLRRVNGGRQPRVQS